MKQSQNNQPDRQTPAVPEENGKKATARGIVRLAVSLAICLCTVGAIFAGAFSGAAPTISDQPTDSSRPSASTEPSASTTTPSSSSEASQNAPASLKAGMYNLLLASVDAEQGMDMVVVNLDVNTHRVNVLGIPRDTLIYTKQKVPTAFAVYRQAEKNKKGTGITAAQDMLKDILGFPVDGYLAVSDAQLEALISATGNITFEVPKEFDDSDTELHAGRQMLEAEEIRQLLRHTEFEDTFTGSAKLHADFVLALLKQCQTAASDADHARTLAGKLVGAVQTKLTQDELQYLLGELAACNLTQVTPIVPKGEVVTPEDVSYYQLSVGDMLKVINRSFNPYEKDLTQYDVYIRNENELSTADYEPYNSNSGTNEPDETDDEPYYPEPTDEPDPEPTDEPDPEPTDEPDPEPTDEPDPEPTENPEPTDELDPEPTPEPAPSDPEA